MSNEDLQENKVDTIKNPIGRPKKERYSQPRNSNNETDIELVTRVLRQSRQRKLDWNANQSARREIAKTKSELSDLVEGYEYLSDLRSIYDDHTLTLLTSNQKIEQRIAQGSEIRIRSRHSNGFAEGLNSRIQRLINNSRGFKNKDYMIYRILKLCRRD